MGKIYLKLKRGQHGAVIGQTGTGKSVLSRQLIIGHKGALCVMDPKRGFKTGLPVYEMADRILKEKPSRFTYRPRPQDLRNMLEYNKVLRYCFERGNILVYIDDIVAVATQYRFPEYLQICYQMGRSKGVSMLACFQRPACLPPFMTSEAGKYFIFRLAIGNDVSRVREYCIGYDPQDLPDLHTFMFYTPGAMERCRRVKINLGKE